MPIVPKSIQNADRKGALIGLYGPTAVGKTVGLFSCFLGRMLYCRIENRNPIISMEVSGRDLEKHPVDIIDYTNFVEFKEFFEDLDNFKNYDIIAIDSISHLMNVSLSREIEDETFNSKKEEEREKKGLILSTKKDFEGWGALAGQMFRIIAPFGRLSAEGKIVVCTFLHDANPSWGRHHSNAPLIDGKKFGDNMGAFFDYIGYLEPRYNDDEEQEPVYPPRVYFHGMPDIYCKWTGVLPEGKNQVISPLNTAIKYILKKRGGVYE